MCIVYKQEVTPIVSLSQDVNTAEIYNAKSQSLGILKYPCCKHFTQHTEYPDRTPTSKSDDLRTLGRKQQGHVCMHKGVGGVLTPEEANK